MGQQLGHNKFVEQALKYGFSLWGLPKTNMKDSYRTGDDGDLEKGYPKAPPRFKDNGDGTITDMATGLMWVADPSQLGGVFGTPGSPSTMIWNTAIDACNALDYAGHKDWRLPNILEYQSITNRGKDWPYIYTTYFKNIQASYYYTSTVDYHAAPNVQNWHGSYGVTGHSSITSLRHAIPVRLGVPK